MIILYTEKRSAHCYSLYSFFFNNNVSVQRPSSDNSILYTAYFILPIKLQYSQVYLRPFTIYKSIYSTDFLPKSKPKMKKTSKIRLGLIMTVWCSTSRLICWQKPQWFLCGRIRACLHIYSTVIFSCAGVYVLPRWLRVGDGQFMLEARGDEGYAWHWPPISQLIQTAARTHTHIERQMSSSKNLVDNQTRTFSELWAVAGPLWDA